MISFFALRCGRPVLSTHLRERFLWESFSRAVQDHGLSRSFAGSPGVRCRLSDSRLFQGQARNSKFKASILQVSSIRRLDVSRRVQGRGKCIPIPRGLESRDSGMGN